jgi:hypothetical protein
VDCLVGRCRAEELRVFPAQLLGRLEQAIGPQVLLPEAVYRAWNVARDGIDRLLQALEALGGARVDELQRRVFAMLLDIVHVHGGALARPRDKRTLARLRNFLCHLAAFPLPQRIAAVQERHALVAQPAQHPPQPHREVAAQVVVDHDLRLRRDPALVHARGEFLDVWKRVPAVLPGLLAGEILVHVQEVRSGNVGLGVGAAPFFGVHEVVANVEDHPLGVGEVLRQLVGRDQHLFHQLSNPASSTCSRFSTRMATMPLATITAIPAHSSGARRSPQTRNVAMAAKTSVEYDSAPTTRVLPVR